MYRAQDIGSRDELISKCVAILRSGKPELLYDILPHISLTREKRFCPLLSELLESDVRDHQIFAAMAFGSFCSERAVGPLSKALATPANFRGPGTQSLQKAIIVALGETGQAAALPPLLGLLDLSLPGDFFRNKRRELVVAAIGALAQHGVGEARDALLDLALIDHHRIAAAAMAELGVVAWQLKAVPPAWVDLARSALAQSHEGLQYAAWGALENWSDLGSAEARELLGSVLSAASA